MGIALIHFLCPFQEGSEAKVCWDATFKKVAEEGRGEAWFGRRVCSLRHFPSLYSHFMYDFIHLISPATSLSLSDRTFKILRVTGTALLVIPIITLIGIVTPSIVYDNPISPDEPTERYSIEEIKKFYSDPNHPLPLNGITLKEVLNWESTKHSHMLEIFNENWDFMQFLYPKTTETLYSRAPLMNRELLLWFQDKAYPSRLEKVQEVTIQILKLLGVTAAPQESANSDLKDDLALAKMEKYGWPQEIQGELKELIQALKQESDRITPHVSVDWNLSLTVKGTHRCSGHQVFRISRILESLMELGLFDLALEIFLFFTPIIPPDEQPYFSHEWKTAMVTGILSRQDYLQPSPFTKILEGILNLQGFPNFVASFPEPPALPATSSQILSLD